MGDIRSGETKRKGKAENEHAAKGKGEPKITDKKPSDKKEKGET